ncbi:hypothetical protein [Salsipaludibacter albus]|uniref:hypothetical protein n=1 Tax=Salsipaludibacter albus TaxID=2849650 RepID=UPI001EE4AE32|nr:hypothetical protein [Salsipaludibacter albus]MBY5160906.1 hypothetical protein [Salsipaludibacter albus]
MVSFWTTAYGLTVLTSGLPNGGGEEQQVSTGLLALAVGLSLVPAAMAAAAFVSRRDDPFIGVLAGMGLAVAVGLPTLLFRNPVASLIVGYSAGAVVAVSRPSGTSWHARAVAAAVVSVIAVVGMSVAFVPTAVIAPALPFTAAGVGDLFAKRDPWAEDGD